MYREQNTDVGGGGAACFLRLWISKGTLHTGKIKDGNEICRDVVEC